MMLKFFESQGGLLLLMFTCLMIFAFVTVAIIFFAPTNDKAFLLFSNLVTGFASSLLTAAQVRKNKDDDKEQPK